MKHKSDPKILGSVPTLVRDFFLFPCVRVNTWMDFMGLLIALSSSLIDCNSSLLDLIHGAFALKKNKIVRLLRMQCLVNVMLLIFDLDKGYTVSVRLGKVLDPYIKLYLQLCGENEESTKIVLRPSGSAADTFQEGKTYMFSVEMPNIGKVWNNSVTQ